MFPLLTREAARALDADAVSRLGIPTLVLMENAGLGAFEVLRARFADRLTRVLLLGGVGQNGGDAWVIARQLALRGFAPRCMLCGPRANVRGDAATNLAALEKLGVTVSSVSEDAHLPLLEAELGAATLVIDGLFGTGLDRAIVGLPARVIALLDGCSATRVALDLPSGVDADSGAVLGVAAKAALTITFAAHKRGLHQHPGAGLAGEVVRVDIGVPPPARAPIMALEPSDVVRLVRPRGADAHKGSAGHTLVLGGSPGRTGAVLLAGLGALRAGAGLVTLAARAGARAALDAKVVELMSEELPAEPSAALAAVRRWVEGKGSLVIGPGLGLDAMGAELARTLALELTLPAVLDADALTACSTQPAELTAARGPRVLTPHPGEAARLLGVSSAEVQADRYAAVARLATLTGAVVVLKGARTLIADARLGTRVCTLDVPALAVAGTGDVLAGVIGALALRMPAFEAACAGVVLHALAGESAARADRGLLAHEVADAIPVALERCRAGA